MSIKAKNQDLSIKLPTLNSKKDFKLWNDNIRNYVGSLQLTHILDYKVQDPILYQNPPASRSSDKVLAAKSAKNGVSIGEKKLSVIPMWLRDSMMGGINVRIYAKGSPTGLPKDLLKFILNSMIIIVDEQLYFLFDQVEKYINFHSNLLSDDKKIITLISTTVDTKVINMINNNSDANSAYHYLVERFQQDATLALQEVRNKFRKLKFKTSLYKYISKFEMIMASYEALGGDRYSKVAYDNFIQGIPSSRYHNILLLYDGTNIDEALDYFQSKAERENNFQDIKRNKILSSNEMKVVASNKMSNYASKKKKVIRCKQCGGFGHILKNCPTQGIRCHVCGEEGHIKVNCPDKRNIYYRVQKLLNDYDHNNDAIDNDKEESDDNSDINNDFSSEDESSSEEDCDDDFILSTNMIHIKKTVYDNISNSYLTLDSGSTKHVSGNSQLFIERNKMKPIKIIDAHGNISITDEIGTIKVQTASSNILVIEKVIYCPKNIGTLLSVRQLFEDNFTLNFNFNNAVLTKSDNLWYFYWNAKSGLYQLKVIPNQQKGIQYQLIPNKNLLNRYEHSIVVIYNS